MGAISCMRYAAKDVMDIDVWEATSKAAMRWCHGYRLPLLFFCVNQDAN